jgi:tetratricopeptide (TPR) repeat protein
MNTATQFTEQGKKQFNRLKLAEAEKSFQSAMKTDGKSIDARMGLARVCLLQNKPNEAESLLNDAIKLAPQNAEALSLKGVLCMHNKLWNDAVLYFEKARKADPGLVTSYVNLAHSHRKLGNFEAAEAAARKAINLNSQNHRAHAELALVLMKTGRAAEAIKEMIETIRINPLYLRAYLALGRLYQISGKNDLTIAIYKKGLQHSPRSIKLREELTRVYAFKGDFPKAYKQAVLIALKRGTDFDWNRVGNFAVAIGQFEKAERAFQKAVQKNAGSWEAHYNLAELYFAAKLYKKAKEKYLLAIEKDGKSYKPFNGMGLLMLMVDRNALEAQKYFLCALELEPNRKEPLLNMALAFADLKAYTEARKYAEATIRAAKPGDGIYEQAEQLLNDRAVR